MIDANVRPPQSPLVQPGSSLPTKANGKPANAFSDIDTFRTSSLPAKKKQRRQERHSTPNAIHKTAEDQTKPPDYTSHENDVIDIPLPLDYEEQVKNHESSKDPRAELPFPYEKILYGPAGEIVKKLVPETEADPVGMLIEL